MYLLTHQSGDLDKNRPQVVLSKLFFVLIFKDLSCHLNYSVWDAF